MGKYYGVANGRRTGVFDNWVDCKQQVDGYSGAKFKSFSTLKEASDFIYSETGASSGERTSVSSPQDRVVYTDGSSLGNGRDGARAGWGVYWGPDDPRNGSGRVTSGEQTNNRGELMAIQKALQTIGNFGEPGSCYEIRADSEYAKHAICKWGDNWELKGWKTARGDSVKNQDLIQANRTILRNLESMGISVTISHVEAHSGNHGNEAADQLAKKGAQEEL